MTQQDHQPAAKARVISFRIDADNAGARLDKWLSDQVEELTRSRLKGLIDAGALTRNGEVLREPSHKLRAGEELTLTVPPTVAADPQAEHIALDVVYEDKDLIVINKQAGIVVHPAAGNWTGTLVNALIAHCGDSLSGIGGIARPGIVHRLDKDTSGLLVVAKHDAAHLGLSKLFQKHNIERVYQAIVIGAPRPGVGTVNIRIARSPKDRKKMAVVPLNKVYPTAREAITHYKVLESFGRARAKLPGDALASLVECRLETGRTHQIRVHMSHLGHPLVGDQTYGRGPGLGGLKPGDDVAEDALKTLGRFRRQALHARVLGFKHPISGEEMLFESDPPKDFQRLLHAFRAL